MKVALCLYGQPRDAHTKVGPLHECVIQPNSCDVFFHAWYDSRNLSIDKMTPGHESRHLHPGTDSFLVNAYRPKSYSIEPQKKFHHKDFTATEENVEACWPYSRKYDRENFIKHKSSCVHSMWYSVMQSLLAKDLYSNSNGFVYDAVILSRFDVSPTSKINIADYNLSSLVTRSQAYPRNEVSDWFMFSNNSNMNIVGSTFFKLEHLYNKIMSSNTKIWTNEAFLRDNLEAHSIPVQRGNFDVTF